MLAGGSYLDLGIIFGTGSTHPYSIFHQVVVNWICDDWLVDISGVEYCKDEDRMHAVVMDFADGSNHLFSGCIGAVDGWIVKIQKPCMKDGVLNPKLSTVGKDSTDLASRPSWIRRSLHSSAASSQEV